VMWLLAPSPEGATETIQDEVAGKAGGKMGGICMDTYVFDRLGNSMQGQVGQRILANAFELGRYVTVIVKRGGKALDRATVTCSDYQNPDCVLDKKYHQGRYRLSDAAPTYYE
jgi:hypothetical protein